MLQFPKEPITLIKTSLLYSRQLSDHDESNTTAIYRGVSLYFVSEATLDVVKPTGHSRRLHARPQPRWSAPRLLGLLVAERVVNRIISVPETDFRDGNELERERKLDNFDPSDC